MAQEQMTYQVGDTYKAPWLNETIVSITDITYPGALIKTQDINGKSHFYNADGYALLPDGTFAQSAAFRLRRKVELTCG